MFSQFKDPTLLKLLMSMAFGQNGLDLALKIEEPLGSLAVYVA